MRSKHSIRFILHALILALAVQPIALSAKRCRSRCVRIQRCAQRCAIRGAMQAAQKNPCARRCGRFRTMPHKAMHALIRRQMRRPCCNNGKQTPQVKDSHTKTGQAPVTRRAKGPRVPVSPTPAIPSIPQPKAEPISQEDEHVTEDSENFMGSTPAQENLDARQNAAQAPHANHNAHQPGNQAPQANNPAPAQHNGPAANPFANPAFLDQLQQNPEALQELQNLMDNPDLYNSEQGGGILSWLKPAVIGIGGLLGLYLLFKLIRR